MYLTFAFPALQLKDNVLRDTLVYLLPAFYLFLVLPGSKFFLFGCFSAFSAQLDHG